MSTQALAFALRASPMHTFTYRFGEDGIDYTRAGRALRALALAAAWLFDPYAFRDVIRMYLS